MLPLSKLIAIARINNEDEQEMLFRYLIDDRKDVKNDILDKCVTNLLNIKHKDVRVKILSALVNRKTRITPELLSLLSIIVDEPYNEQLKIANDIEQGKDLKVILNTLRLLEFKVSYNPLEIWNIKPEIKKISSLVYCGDSEIVLRGEKVLRKIESDSVDFVFTSPPYYGETFEFENDQWQSYDEYLEKMKRIFKGVYRVVKRGRIVAVNVSPTTIDKRMKKRYALSAYITRTLEEVGFDYYEKIYWVKQSGIGKGASNSIKSKNPLYFGVNQHVEEIILVTKGKINAEELKEKLKYKYKTSFFEKHIRPYLSSVWVIYVNPRYRYHQFAFPPELVEVALNCFTLPGETVLDCFAGGGTTGAVAKTLFRNSILIERKKENISIIRENVLKGCNNVQTIRQTDITREIKATYKGVEVEYYEEITDSSV